MSTEQTREQEQAARLAEIGKSAYAALAEMVAALECDYDRLEELREEHKDLARDCANTSGIDDTTEYDAAVKALAEWKETNGEELNQLETDAGDCKDRDDAEQRIHEDPLSIEVRSDWYTPGTLTAADASIPAEFRILLGTGGPAVRIIGELDANGEPKSATLQTQDWFLPWTDYRGDECSEETLLTYCRCFYFGEG